jgi:hypothetical protein
VAIPTAIATKMKATSRLSLTAFRKRMIERAPTRVNARAMLLPMTSMMREMVTPMMIMACTNDTE